MQICKSYCVTMLNYLSSYIKFQSAMENKCTYLCLFYTSSPTHHFKLLKCMSINKLAFIKATCLSLSAFTESESVTDYTGNNIFLCRTLMFSSLTASTGCTQKTGCSANWLSTQYGMSFHQSTILWPPDSAFVHTKTKLSGFKVILLCMAVLYCS